MVIIAELEFDTLSLDKFDEFDEFEELDILFPKDINNTPYNINTIAKIIITLGFNNKLFI
jgi:hypothetical protein